MGVYIKGMDMPKYCISKEHLRSNCPMDRLWCMQEFAPKDMTRGQVEKDQTEKLPSWCPLVELKEREDGLCERIN